MTFATGGSEALDLVRMSPPNVVVSDVRMPQIDGAELMNQIAANNPEVIRFVLSGQAEKVKILGLVGVAHQYFSKPCDVNHLFEAVEKVRSQQQKVKNDLLVHAINGLGTIPCRPDVYEKLGATLKSDVTTIDDVKKIIKLDIGLSAKVLQLVGSSFFGSPAPACPLDQACDILGRELLKELFFQSTAFVPMNKELAKPIATKRTPIAQQISDRLFELFCSSSGSRPLANSKTCSLEGRSAPEWNAAASYLLTLWRIHLLENDSTVYGSSSGQTLDQCVPPFAGTKTIIPQLDSKTNTPLNARN